MSQRRVVITGLGILSSIGLNAPAFWEGLSQGRSGIRRIKSLDVSTHPCPIAGEIDGFEPKNYIDKKERKSLRVMARLIQLAVAAAQVAMDDAGVKKDQVDPTRFGVEFGSGFIPSDLHDIGPASVVSTTKENGKVSLKTWGDQGISNIPPLWMLKYLPNMAACHVSILQNAQGPSNSITESDVAGLLALAEATRIIRRDAADYFLVGGADSRIHPLSLVRQAIIGRVSLRSDAPEKASRPFDAHRDGMVIGEGGAVVAIEELEHARRRGARIYAEVLGIGSTFDRGCAGKGIARAIHVALRQANVDPSQIDHISAHGLSHPDTDAWEARGLREAFPECPTVWGVKSYIGNMCAGGGLAELTASVLAQRHGVLPGTLNFETPDPRCPVPVCRESRPIAKPYFVKVSLTELGQCAAVVCRRWEA